MRKVFLMFVFVVFLSACGKGDSFEKVLDWEVGEFSYLNQNSSVVTLEDLKGHIWLADFIFTNCDTVCSPMTYNLNRIQQDLEAQGLTDVKIVSFSVDPDNDTPEVLKEYSSRFGLNEENWHFLTGYSQEEIATFAKNYFKTIVQDDKNSNQVMHGTSFYLIDQNGIVVKNYNGVNEVPYEEIIEDIKWLHESMQ